MSKAKGNSIEVQGSAITVVSNDTGDFISLTDMAKKFGDDVLIYNWMRTQMRTLLSASNVKRLK